MRRALTLLTILAVPLLALEARSQSIQLDPAHTWTDGDPLRLGECSPTPLSPSFARTPQELAIGMVVPAQGIHAGGSHGPAPSAPFRPVGAPTGWVTAKSLAHITLVGGGSGSAASSCVNRGSAGGTFAQPSIGNEPRWYDDGFLGAGRPYFWIPGQSLVRCFIGSLPSSAYITANEFTLYTVMYAHALEANFTGSQIAHNATAIEFSEGGALAVRAGDGGVAIGLHADTPTVDYDAVELPITSGDSELHVWKLEHRAGLLSISVDGGAPLSVASGPAANLNGAPIVGFNGQHFNVGVFYGAIAEWIVYDRPLTPGEDRANLAYLRNEWGTP